MSAAPQPQKKRNSRSPMPRPQGYPSLFDGLTPLATEPLQEAQRALAPSPQALQSVAANTFMDNKQRIWREQHEERLALNDMAWPHFNGCVAYNRLPDAITVIQQHAKKDATEEHITASQVYKAWLTFRRLALIELNTCTLDGVVGPLTERFTTWLTTEYTARYRAIEDQRQMIWLRQVARLVVTHRIMETKFMYAQQGAFADPVVEARMSAVFMLRNYLIPEMHKAAHHSANGNQQYVKELLDRFSEGILRFFQLATIAKGEPQAPLPPPMPRFTDVNQLPDGEVE